MGVTTALIAFLSCFQSFVLRSFFPTHLNTKQKHSSLTDFFLCMFPGWSLPLAPCRWRLLKASRSWLRLETSRPSAGTSCDWSPKMERCVDQHLLPKTERFDKFWFISMWLLFLWFGEKLNISFQLKTSDLASRKNHKKQVSLETNI